MKRSTVRAETRQEEFLFFRRWVAHPLKVGALLPSSPFLARLVARHTRIGDDDVVVELGAGTGAVTKALLDAGIPKERLFVIEIDADMCTYLRKWYPQAQVIHGDAGALVDILPRKHHGKVATVISGIPMITLPEDVQARLIRSWLGQLKPGGRLLQYTYSLISPIPQKKFGLSVRRAGMTFLNLPPASVFKYEKL
ncbi:MAG: methyltransferase domain-containing protein [Alphaproteobacteria bacterium]|nr:methyltransferase domain-containing protein [Alphaproteobacteria bacterium]